MDAGTIIAIIAGLATLIATIGGQAVLIINALNRTRAEVAEVKGEVNAVAAAQVIQARSIDGLKSELVTSEKKISRAEGVEVTRQKHAEIEAAVIAALQNERESVRRAAEAAVGAETLKVEIDQPSDKPVPVKTLIGPATAEDA